MQKKQTSPLEAESDPTRKKSGDSATNPGLLSVSMELLKTFHPFLATGDATAFPEDAKAFEQMTRDRALQILTRHLQNGDCRGALVLEASEERLLIAAYSDDLDACVVLATRGDVAKELFRRHALAPGRRLITSNTYTLIKAEDIPSDGIINSSGFDVDALMHRFEQRRRELLQTDIVLGEVASSSPFYAFWPIIADFISEDQEQLGKLQSTISPDEWRRIDLLAKGLNDSAFMPRNLAPFYSGNAGIANPARKVDDIAVHMIFLFNGGNQTRANDLKSLLLANFPTKESDIDTDTIFQNEQGAGGFLRLGGFDFQFLEIGHTAPGLDSMIQVSAYPAEDLQELRAHSSHMVCSCRHPPGRIKDQILGMIRLAHGLVPHGLLGVIHSDSYQVFSRKMLKITSEDPAISDHFDAMGFLLFTSKVPFQVENGKFLATKGNHLFGIPDLVIWDNGRIGLEAAAKAIDNIMKYLIGGARIQPGHTMNVENRTYLAEVAPAELAAIRGPGQTLLLRPVDPTAQPNPPHARRSTKRGNAGRVKSRKTPVADASGNSSGLGCTLVTGILTIGVFALVFWGGIGPTWQILGFAAGLILGLITITTLVAHIRSIKR
ncbi:hypothetical protein LBMAG53_24740 [Planctomycetota bacterium]|nr:hypothetical protein LBMAG53_24740 [Planctomycetota bacterium]